MNGTQNNWKIFPMLNEQLMRWGSILLLHTSTADKKAEGKLSMTQQYPAAMNGGTDRTMKKRLPNF